MQNALNRIIELNKQIMKKLHLRSGGNPMLLNEIRELTEESSELAFDVSKQITEQEDKLKQSCLLEWVDVNRTDVKPNIGETYLVTIKRRDEYMFWDKATYHKFGWNISPMCKVIAWCKPIMYQENLKQEIDETYIL